MKQKYGSRIITTAVLIVLALVLQLASVCPVDSTSGAPVGTPYGVYSWPAEFPVNPNSFDLLSQPPEVLAGTTGKPPEPKFNQGPNWYFAVGTNSATAPVFKDIVNGSMTVGSTNGTGSINNYFVSNSETTTPRTNYQFLTNGLAGTRFNRIDSAGYFGINQYSPTNSLATVMAVAWEAPADGNATITHLSPGNKAYDGPVSEGQFEESWESAYLKVWKVPAGGGAATQLWPLTSQSYTSAVQTSGFELQPTLSTTNFPQLEVEDLEEGDRIYFTTRGPDSQPWWTMNIELEESGTPPPAIQLDINWGAMEFTYYDTPLWNPETHTYTSGWASDELGGNEITVTNNSEIDLDVEFIYTPVKTSVTGGFVDSIDTPVDTAVPIDTGQSLDTYLVLDGLPSETNWNDVTLGSVTIRIGGD